MPWKIPGRIKEGLQVQSKKAASPTFDRRTSNGRVYRGRFHVPPTHCALFRTAEAWLFTGGGRMRFPYERGLFCFLDKASQVFRGMLHALPDHPSITTDGSMK